MDEPTNDLDAETLELLENLLVEFPGTLLLVSHDRAFLNNVVTSTMVFEADAPADPSSMNTSAAMTTGCASVAPTVAAPAKAMPKIAPKVAPPKPARKARFSAWEQRELAALPARIEALEAEQSALVEKMAEPAFYQNGGNATVEVTARLGALEAELAAAFARWEELLAAEQATLEAASETGKRIN